MRCGFAHNGIFALSALAAAALLGVMSCSRASVGPDILTSAIDGDEIIVNSALIEDFESDEGYYDPIGWTTSTSSGSTNTFSYETYVDDGVTNTVIHSTYVLHALESGAKYVVLQCNFADTVDMYSQGNALMWRMRASTVQMVTNPVQVQFQVPNPNNENRYWDVFNYSVKPTMQWQTFIVPYTNFAQSGFSGDVRTLEEDLSRVARLEFRIGNGDAGEYELDDISVVTVERKR